MKTNQSPYTCMYLVTKEIYEKLLLSIDERDKKKIEQLNVHNVGNLNGAFPQIPPPPPPLPPPPPPHPPLIPDDAMDPNARPPPPPPSPPAPDSSTSSFHSPRYSMFSVDDNYIDDDIISDTNNLHLQATAPIFSSTSETNKNKKTKTDNRALIKKSRKPILYKNIPQAKETPLEIITDSTQNNVPLANERLSEMTVNKTAPVVTDGLTYLLRRERERAEKRRGKCPICQITFLNNRAMLNHKRKMHPDKKDIKKPFFIMPPIMKEDSKQKKYENWVEKETEIVVPEISGNVSNIAVEKCRMCETEFNDAKRLKRHLYNIHECNEYYVPFSQPSKGIKRKLSQTRFSGSNVAKKKFGKFFYKCKFCSFLFANESALLRHSKNIHNISNIDGVNKYALPKGIKRKELAQPEIFKCSVCSMEFDNKSYYISHLRLKHSVNQKYSKDKQKINKPTKKTIKKPEPQDKPNKKAKTVEYDNWM